MSGTRVVLTGATGFVGKVVLSELVRRRQELGIERIDLVIRRANGRNGAERFEDIAASPAMTIHHSDWQSLCRVIEADLSEDQAFAAASAQATDATHIIHCAASVEFDLPVAAAARANIATAMNVLALARRCPELKQMVSVSTAYVTPRPGLKRAIREELYPLPHPPEAMYAEMRAARSDPAADAAFLAETGHPNTYTLTKCVAEHLLWQRRGDVPLTIVRPSIVSACWQHPFPGWLDSRAALAGFVALIGTGYLRAVSVDPKARLDIIPCDAVAERILNAAFAPPLAATNRPTIRHATAGPERSNTIESCCRVILDYFERHPQDRKAVLHYKGRAGLRFQLHDALHHRLPLATGKVVAQLGGRHRVARSAERLQSGIQQLHQDFPYFTYNTFAFETSVPLDKGFEPERYIEIVCRGVHRYLLAKSEETLLAGRTERRSVRLAAKQPRGNMMVRTMAAAVLEGLRRSTDRVTFDHGSFEDALDAVPKGNVLVLAPTHRSYLDFMLCPLVFFLRPELGIGTIRSAAADEFSRLPVVGWALKQGGAFYIKRGAARANRELNSNVKALVATRDPLLVFIEGQRSRDRSFLTPRTGFLRALRESGQRFSILPIAISYDRLPEETALLRELRTGNKARMSIWPLLGWISQLLGDQVSLGRIHLKAGELIEMNASSEVPAVARQVMAELQGATVATTYHLRSFLSAHRLPGVDVRWLRAQIEARGGQVVDSGLSVDAPLDPLLERCLRNTWSHWFVPEALALFHDRPEMVDLLRERDYRREVPAKISPSDPRLTALLMALFDPSFAEPRRGVRKLEEIVRRRRPHVRRVEV